MLFILFYLFIFHITQPNLNPIKMSGVNRRGEAPTWTWKSEGSGMILDEGMLSDLLLDVFQTRQAL